MATSNADRERYRRQHEYGCVCCRIIGFPILSVPLEMHHIVDRGYRSHSGGNVATLPLCRWHHQGVPPSVHMTKKIARAILGPALADGKRPFIQRWGTERELLERVNKDVYGEGLPRGSQEPGPAMD